MRKSLTAQNKRGGAFMLKKTPCITLIFSVFLFLLLFANVNLASAQSSEGTQDCANKQVPSTLEFLRLGLTPSPRMTEGGITNPYSLIPNPLSMGSKSGQNDSTVESDAQLSAKRVGQRAMYRLYNQWTGEHFYTCSEEERDKIAKVGWTKEDIGWVSPKESSTPVYRLYNKYIPGGDHHYTPSASERDSLVKVGWIYEGIGWYSADEGSLFRAPVYRQYNPYADTGTHNYTLSTSERDNLVKAGWRDEGVGYYGLDQSLMSAIDFDKDIKVTTDSKVYNGRAQTQTITSSNLKLNDDYIVEYSNNKNVGTATITITGTNGFYGEKVYTFQITQKTISQVRWGDLEFGYDGKAHVPTATAVGLCSGDSATITVTASGNHKDTGTYTATATAISNKNYKLASNFKTDFRIGTKIDFDNKNKPTVDTADEIYTGSAITKEVSVPGLIKDRDYSVTYKDNTNVGTATLTIKGIGEYFGEKSYTFKINQRDISDATVTLGTSLTYNGEAQKQTISKVAIDLDGTELVVPASSYVVSENEKTDADSYTLKITGNGNFKGSVSKDFDIAKLDITNATVMLGEALTYNGEVQEQTVARVVATSGNKQVEIPASCYTISNNTGQEADTYTLTVTAKEDGNFTGSVDKAFTISALSLANAEVTLGDDLTYNATEQEQTVTKVVVKAGNKEIEVPVASYSVTNNRGTNAGDHKLTITANEGNFAGSTQQNFKIAQLDISIATVTLGDSLTYNAKEQAQGVASVKVGDLTVPVADYLVSDNKQTNAGTYDETNALKIKPSSTNNLTGQTSKDFTIDQLDISSATVTLGTALTYNGSEQTQVVASVKVGELTVPVADYLVSDNKQTNAGTYDEANALKIKPSSTNNLTGQTSKDFTIDQLDITNATVTLGTGLTYDTTKQTQTVTKVEVGNLTLTSSDYILSGNEQTNAGKHTLEVKGQGNFKGTARKEFEIAKATPTYVTPSGLVGYYGEILSEVTFTQPDNGAFSWDASTTVLKELGDKEFSITFTPKDTNNYLTVTGLKSTLTVKREVLDKDKLRNQLKDLAVSPTSIMVVNGKNAALEGLTSLTTDGIQEDGMGQIGIYQSADTSVVYIAPMGARSSEIFAPEDCSFLFSTDGALGAGLDSVTNLSCANLNTTLATNMTSMFSGCSKIATLDISGFDTSKVTDMSSMFNGCAALSSVSVASFNTSAVTSMANMFNGCSSLPSLDLSNFVTSKVTSMESMFNGCNALSSLKVSKFNTSEVTNMASMFSGCSAVTSLGVSKFDTSKVTTMKEMFKSCSSVYSLNVSNFDTSSVTDMEGMFRGCANLDEIDVTGFVTSEVTTMARMFASCSSLPNLDVSKLNTSKVTDMSSMFEMCTSLPSVDLTNFDTSNVTSLNSMFFGCMALNDLDVTKFVTSKVTDMSSMFTYCSALPSIDLTKFDTSNVETLSGMFYRCTSLTELNLASFNTKKVTSMAELFYSCSNLVTIYVSSGGFVTSSVTDDGDMFYSCNKLVGGAGTTWSYVKTGWLRFATIDKGPSSGTPGYFTEWTGSSLFSNSALSADSDQKMSTDGSRVTMFRLYNKWTGEHFYTSSISERDKNVKLGWNDEEIGWYAPTSENFKPVYRLYNKYVEGGDHHYTTSSDEKDACVKAGWTYEGEGWRTVTDENATDYIKVLRQYNPYAATGTHNYTTNTKEQDELVKAGWRAEGVGWGGYSTLNPTSTPEPEPDPTVEELDFSKFTVDTGDRGYCFGEITPSVNAVGLKEGTDYTVTYSDNINAGTGRILITGIGNYTGSKEYTFTITPTSILFLSIITIDKKSFTYDGSAKTANVTKVELSGHTLTASKDYVVTENTATTPGTYKLKVTGTGNFDGTETREFYVNRAGLKVTDVKVKDKPYDQTAKATVEDGWKLTGVIGDDDVSVDVSAEFTSGALKNETNYSVPVNISYNITGEQRYYYEMSKESDSVVTAGIFYSINVKFETNGGGAIASQWVADGGSATRPDDPTQSGKTFAGWYLNEDFSYADFNFREPVFEGMKYYAKWIDNKDIAGVWLQEPKAETPSSSSEDSVSSSQIKSDINVLRAGAGNASYATTKSKWEGYMAGETEKHLYTTWHAEDAGDGANQWAEFRIMQVGAHDSDGSTVTFMATHSLPTAKKMNEDPESTTAWSDSDMHKTMNGDGSYVMAGLKDLVSSVTPVKKMQATYDSGTSAWSEASLTTDGDTFWLMSYSELFSETSGLIGTTFKAEGSQYAWCKTNVGNPTDPTVACEALAGIAKTRANASPTGISGTQWWERSPDVTSTNNYGNVMSAGGQGASKLSSLGFGVVPCFCF